jgi:pyruvate dehydrogenase E1 component beta subunit
MKRRQLTFCDAINEAFHQEMAANKNILMYGLENKVFGSTRNLEKKFGSKRFFFTPLSEDMLTGMTLGLSLAGKIPIFNHIRVDFLLLGINQIFNMISSYKFSVQGKLKTPMLIRAVIGRGWGQGPQHSQSLESIFAHIPGLKVVCPSNPYNAKGLLISSIEDNNHVIFFEHRWSHGIKGYVPEKYYKTPIGKSNDVTRGKDLTIVTFSYMVNEAMIVNKILKKNKIFAEIIDLQSLRPLDKKKFLISAKKTKKILVIDNGLMQYGISSEILAIISENMKNKDYSISRVGIADSPIPSTVALAKFSYPNHLTIIKEVEKLIKIKIKISKPFKLIESFDQPNKNFMGPF